MSEQVGVCDSDVWSAEEREIFLRMHRDLCAEQQVFEDPATRPLWYESVYEERALMHSVPARSSRSLQAFLTRCVADGSALLIGPAEEQE